MLPQDARAERRRRKAERRAKQRLQNVVRAKEMHEARLEFEREQPDAPGLLRRAAPRNDSVVYHIGCSGWFYWHWGGSFYPESIPRTDWFQHYAKHFDTVELNAPFYGWPTLDTVATWKRQAGRRRFVYAIKVNDLITHVKRFSRTGTLVKDFGLIADLLGPRFGCFLFQLPPSFHYSAAALSRILKQLDHRRVNVVEFRHASWWNDKVFEAFRQHGTVFCSTSAPKLPRDLVKTADHIYVRFHGTSDRWYLHDYSKEELADWAKQIRDSGAKTVWAYFNNDRECHAIKNALALRRLLKRANTVRPERSASAVEGRVSRRS